jgi:hypothetical protein
MILQEIIDNKMCPVIRCDYCGELIENADQAIVLFHPDGGVPKFYHKTRCDVRTPECGWVSLPVFLYYLVNNVHVDFESAKKLAAIDSALAR